MNRPSAPQPTVPLGTALDGNATLSALLQRLQQSQARYAAIRQLLPPGLADQVKPGQLDESHWTLVVASGATAAKLRQCLPTLETALRESGFPSLPLRIKVIRDTTLKT